LPGQPTASGDSAPRNVAEGFQKVEHIYDGFKVGIRGPLLDAEDIRRGHCIEVMQVTGQKSALFRYYDPIQNRNITCLLRGISMEGIVDGTCLQLSGEFAVTGTKSYNTAIGARRTVFVIEPTAPEPEKPVIVDSPS
jgi:hypothetical protein